MKTGMLGRKPAPPCLICPAKRVDDLGELLPKMAEGGKQSGHLTKNGSHRTWSNWEKICT